MAHLLLLEVPGGNDFMILEEAVRLGHTVSFFTGDLRHYLATADLTASSLSLAQSIVDIHPFTYEAFEQRAMAIHAKTPFDAILCLIDTRLIEASQLAATLSLPFLNPATATLLRDKFSVRATLARHGIRQPAFALATSNEELRGAIETLGFPVLIKPSDGYGSQNITVLFSDEELPPLVNPAMDYLPCRTDYGLGVQANDRLVVEQFIQGTVIGCDTFSRDGEHLWLGVNEKEFFPPPSFAIRGGCFPSERYDLPMIREYVCHILDVLQFNFGAAHTELLVTPEGPYLIEVNPRLVGAHIPRLLGYALNRSIYEDLIHLHLGHALTAIRPPTSRHVAVTRWITAEAAGTLTELTLPTLQDPRIRRVQMFKSLGNLVRPPFNNGDRIGYIMTVGHTQNEAEQVAEGFLQGVRIRVDEHGVMSDGNQRPVPQNAPAGAVSPVHSPASGESPCLLVGDRDRRNGRNPGDALRESHAVRSAMCRLPTPFGEFALHGFVDPQTGVEHAALVMGAVTDGMPVLTRLHSECLTGDRLLSLRCDCGPQLMTAMKTIAREGRGVLVYLRQEGRGIGLVNKIRAYALQEAGIDTVDANRLLGLPDDMRDYTAAKVVLDALGIHAVRLMTNNPAKVQALERLSIPVIERIPLHVGRTVYNAGYLETKCRRMGHVDTAIALQEKNRREDPSCDFSVALSHVLEHVD